MVTEHDYMVSRVRDHAFADDAEFERFFRGSSELAEARTLDYLFATSHDPHQPAEVFDTMRWGGQFIFASRHSREVAEVAGRFRRHGFIVERGPERVYRRWCGVPVVSLRPPIHFFVARKVLLVPPGEHTSRFTYDVRLEKHNGQYVVVKQLPDPADVYQRLRDRRERESGDLEQQAEQLVRSVLPVFLTREAAFLQILQRDLPEADRCRVPAVIDTGANDRGLVEKLRLNWLRKTDRLMSEIDFAVQAADLLHKLHHNAKVIHLDLRLDNFVITDDGVGFVDFGSAARADEDITASPLLQKLFAQLMKTSQVQRMLRKMSDAGAVTAEFITAAHGRVDRAVDLFYLAMQLDKTASNPYTRELVCHHPGSAEARRIARLTRHVLQPQDPQRPMYASARDLLRALREIKEGLNERSRRRTTA